MTITNVTVCQCGWYLDYEPSDAARDIHDSFVALEEGVGNITTAIHLANGYVLPGEIRSFEDLVGRHTFQDAEAVFDLAQSFDELLRDTNGLNVLWEYAENHNTTFMDSDQSLDAVMENWLLRPIFLRMLLGH